MCQNPTSLPMENRQKKCVKCPKAPRRKPKKIEIARLILWASFATPLSAAPHQTRLQIGKRLAPPETGASQASPSFPLFPNKAHAGPHLDLRNHLGSARRPQMHVERLQNRFGRRVEKRARVIFEIMTWRRIISDPGSGIPG